MSRQIPKKGPDPVSSSEQLRVGSSASVPQYGSLVLLTKRWGHHSASSGYDRLADEFDCTKLKRTENTTLIDRIERAVWNRTTHPRKYLCDYRFEDYQIERRALRLARTGGAKLIHVLYGDEQLDMLLRRRSDLPCPLIATFHVPASTVAERFRTELPLLKRLDTAVVVSRSQLESFRRWLGPEKVVYVPHGIDINAFAPAKLTNKSDRLRLLIVGFHLRDFKFLSAVVERCASDRLPIDFVIVGAEPVRKDFEKRENIIFHDKISEEKLVAIYNSADALFLPVIDATANNAVLESLACGTPIITTKIGGMSDYVDDSVGFLLEGSDIIRAVQLLVHLSERRDVLTKMRIEARRRAEMFSWEKIALAMRLVYKRTLSRDVDSVRLLELP